MRYRSYEDDRTRNIVVISLIGVAAIAIVASSIWACSSSDEKCAVTGASWRYTTRVDRYQIVTREGFTVPNKSFDIHDLGPRYHHSETEMYYSVWDGEWKTRQKSIYHTWYKWKIWDWTFNRDVVETSNNLSEAWFPNPDKVALNKNISTGEQEKSNNFAQYDLVCQDVQSNKVYVLHPSSLDELVKLKEQKYHVVIVPHVGDEVKLKQ